MKRFALLGLVVLAAGCGSTKTVTQTVTNTVTKTVIASPECAASDLSAAFDAIPGSQGAGNIVYSLVITNTSANGCELTLTRFQLLDTTGASNPTNISPPPGTLLLHAGESLKYNARFSPSVNGTGDNTNGQCQPTSATLRISASGGGTVDAPISPPTPVCEKGSMTLTTA